MNVEKEFLDAETEEELRKAKEDVKAGRVKTHWEALKELGYTPEDYIIPAFLSAYNLRLSVHIERGTHKKPKEICVVTDYDLHRFKQKIPKVLDEMDIYASMAMVILGYRFGIWELHLRKLIPVADYPLDSYDLDKHKLSDPHVRQHNESGRFYISQGSGNKARLIVEGDVVRVFITGDGTCVIRFSRCIPIRSKRNQLHVGGLLGYICRRDCGKHIPVIYRKGKEIYFSDLGVKA